LQKGYKPPERRHLRDAEFFPLLTDKGLPKKCSHVSERRNTTDDWSAGGDHLPMEHESENGHETEAQRFNRFCRIAE
jgi:hypothetical protein